MRDMVKMAQTVHAKIKSPDQSLARPHEFKSPVDGITSVLERLRRHEHRKPWAERVQEAESKLSQNEESCGEAQKALHLEQVKKEIHRAIEHVGQGAEALLSDECASALQSAAGEFAKVGVAFEWIAELKTEPVLGLASLVAEQPAASLYEIYEIVEESARKSALRMGTAGLAFSGGGIRSATFNLGFLQGAAALGLLKQFDYLSTVSGGGYIGAWFAAWVLREGGRESNQPSELDFIRGLAALSAAETRINDEVPRSPHTAGDQQAPAATPRENSIEAKAPLQKLCELRLMSSVKDVSDVPKRRKDLVIVADVANVLQFRMFDGAGGVVVDIDETRLLEQKEQIKKLREHLASLWRRKRLTASEKGQVIAAVTSIVEPTVQKRYDDEVAVKRQRTSQALQNVQKQLSSSRACQATAVRRWAWPAGNPPLPPKPTLEDEPEPVHHLREHSNYLSPRLGLWSLDTWTMVSVYLRNLFLNQFIVLPMLLVVVTVPRLFLLLFTGLTSGSTFTLARGWLGWLVQATAVAVALAVLTAPQLLDFFAQRVVKWLHRWKAKMATLLLLALGEAMLARVSMTVAQRWRGPFPPKAAWRIAALVGSLSSRNPAATDLMGFLLAVVLTAVIAPLINRSRDDNGELWVAQGPYQRIKAWTTLAIVVVGIESLAVCAVTLVLDLFEYFMEWATGDRDLLTADRFLFLVTLYMAWLGFRGTYETVAQIRKSRRLPAVASSHDGAPLDLAKLKWRMRRIIIYLTTVSFGVSLFFGRPGKPFFACPLPVLGDWFDPAKVNWFGMGKFWAAVCFGAFVGLMRLLSSLSINLWDRSLMSARTAFLRAHSGFSSGLISGAGLAAALSWLNLVATVQTHETTGVQPDGPGRDHDVVRPRARDDRHRCGFGDRGRLDRRLRRGGHARVAGEPRRLLLDAWRAVDGALRAIDIRPALLVVGWGLGCLRRGGRVGGHFSRGHAGGPERKDRRRRAQEEPTRVPCP